MKKATIVGGYGHVGLPLGLALAKTSHNVTLLDINQKSIYMINSGICRFLEEDAEEIVPHALGKNLRVIHSTDSLKTSNDAIFVTGTSVEWLPCYLRWYLYAF